MKKSSLFLAASASILTACQTLPPAKSGEFVILHTNDHHGHPAAFDDSPGKNVGGLPARYTLVQQVRQEHKNVVVVDAGDWNTGFPESNMFYAEPDLLAYNKIGYDMATLGNHEFDINIDKLKWQASIAKFPFISANVKLQNGKDPEFTKPYIIKDFNGFKVAFLGLTTEESKTLGDPTNIKDYSFKDAVEIAKVMVPQLKKEAHVVVALVHLGLYPNGGSERLAQEVEGLDLIIDGHSHSKLKEPAWIENKKGHKTPIVSAWEHGKYVGKVHMQIIDGKVSLKSFENLPVNTQIKNALGEVVLEGKQIAESQEIKDILKPFMEKAEKALDEVVWQSPGVWDNADLRKKETPLGNFVADAMFEFTKENKPDFTVQNGGGIRAKLPEGKITVRDINTILPFTNTVVIMELKGSDVLELFKQMVQMKPGVGAFPSFSKHVKLHVKEDDSFTVTISEKEINPEKTYRIVTNSYLGDGGDGYTVFKQGKKVLDTSVFQKEAMIQYLKDLNLKEIPQTEGRYIRP